MVGARAAVWVANLARETVTAHLQKLERDGRVRRAGEAWHIIET